MGTKNKPSKFDCYGKAKPDEPTFTLIARDPLFEKVVRYWKQEAEAANIHLHKLDEAEQIAVEGAAYRAQLEAGTVTAK